MINKFIQKQKDLWRSTVEGYKYMVAKMRELGPARTAKVIWDDLFANRTLGQWTYLIILSIIPLAIELYYNGGVSDWWGMWGSITGIVCVIMVAEGRASNYAFGLINSIIYTFLTIDSGFYGEVATTLYFLIMQPIGLLVWLAASREKKVEQEFVAKRLDAKGWVKYIVITILWWGVFGFIYKSIGSKRPFRDSVTDGTQGVGQLLMTGVYAEQWVFWIATNLFSIYLWHGESLQMQGMFWVYLLNSCVGAYRWYKEAKK